MKTNRTDSQVLMTVSRLQEFYTSSSLHGFFKRCERQEVDVVEAFIALDALVMSYVRESGMPPDLGKASDTLLGELQKGDGHIVRTSGMKG